MHLHTQPKVTFVESSELRFELLESGDIRRITDGKNEMINQLVGNLLDGSASNLFLRVHTSTGIRFTKLIGLESPSRFQITDQSAHYTGSFEGVDYHVMLNVVNEHWFYRVQLTSDVRLKVDVIYGQDIGIAGIWSVRNNEAYCGQYIDHKVYQNPMGPTLCFRQNQGTPHYLELGGLTPLRSYSTDGFQFYGLSYKQTNQIEALSKETLDNSIYQYEFTFGALQTELITLEGTQEVAFYGTYVAHHPEVIRHAMPYQPVLDLYHALPPFKNVLDGLHFALHVSPLNVYAAPDFSTAELHHFFPHRLHEEYDENTLLSFFLPEHQHVVLPAKEVRVERPHGSIIITGNNNYLKRDELASTTYMVGVFGSQVVTGNSSFTRLNSNTRNPLNVQKISGMRIYVKRNGTYELLTMPSAYEMGINYAKWYYKWDDDVLLFTSLTTVDTPELVLQFESLHHRHYDLLITQMLVLGETEYQHAIQIVTDEDHLHFKPVGPTFTTERIPNFGYDLYSDHTYTMHHDGLFYAHHRPEGEPVFTLEYHQVAQLQLTWVGYGGDYLVSLEPRTLEQHKREYLEFYRKNVNGFELHHPHKDIQAELSKLNDLVYWYTNNALVHYSSPHGLEQYNGAAWGLRDVCQGPVEYFMAMQHFDVVRDILIKVFANQFSKEGDWPQWFMFDQFANIRADESHGDVIVWPLRTIAYYLQYTGDLSILEEKVPYYDKEKHVYTSDLHPIIDHLIKEVHYIKEHLMPGTALSNYGDGDWDDTLQPANAELKKQMVSGWTVALTYEALKVCAHALRDQYPSLANDWLRLSEQMSTDFHHHLIRDGVPAGFVRFTDQGVIPVIHPSDTTTGMKYRLLPFNQAMIAELFHKEQIAPYVDLIDRHLMHPDGVRLMDHTVQYDGGAMTYFKRAETAANFGREIGLQYVHAHIRYIEAMAKVGDASRAWTNLFKIVPIKMKDSVANAEWRQANAYFSSSDGRFATRYDAMRDFHLLRTGDVAVKGGWRVYSSGPGIFLNQIVTNLLGVRMQANHLELDPVLPASYDGLIFSFSVHGLPATFKYHHTQGGIQRVVLNGHEIPFTRVNNRYRVGGVVLDEKTYRHHLHLSSNTFELYGG